MMISFLGLTLFAIIHVSLALPAEVTLEYLDMLRATKQDEKFAELMGIPDAKLVRASDERSEDHMLLGRKVSPFGDILLTQEQYEQARQGIRFERYPGSKWRGNVIPYTITKSDYSDDEVKHIEEAIQTLNNSMTNLKIRQYRSGDNDYVTVFSGRGCYANLGRIGGKQSVSLQRNGCLRTGTIQHEFIHSAGFLHEHMRPDRDDYIKILPENIPPEWQSQYEKASGNDFGIQGPYDYYSVMHYPVPAPGTGRPAFEVYNKNVDERYIGQRWGPTRTDIDKINYLYS